MLKVVVVREIQDYPITDKRVIVWKEGRDKKFAACANGVMPVVGDKVSVYEDDDLYFKGFNAIALSEVDK